MKAAEGAGTLPAMIANPNDVYRGNLVHYFRVIFRHAQNLRHPYHNFRHMMHVTWQCYQACIFYGDRLTRLDKRMLLVAAMFHDFDHSGMFGDDDLNIERAVRGFRRHCAPEDSAHVQGIVELIKSTQYPHVTPSPYLNAELVNILRDADLSQAFSTAWIQQVIFGLAKEWGESPMSVMRKQIPFTEGLHFASEWGRETFPEELIAAKRLETMQLLQLLEDEAQTQTA